MKSETGLIKQQVHCVRTIKEFVERLQEHEVTTTSKFVLVKSCKKFTQDKVLLTEKLKLHWQDEVPYFHFGTRLYLCHQGKDNNKYQKKKYAENREMKAELVKRYNLTKVSKKKDCPAFVRVTRVIRILEHKMTEPITNHRKGMISNLIKKQIVESKTIGEECFIFNLPTAEEHKFHLLGPNSTAIEPVDRRVREFLATIVHAGERDLVVISKKLIEFVQNDLGEYDTRRRRFYPDSKTLRKYVSRIRTNMNRSIISQMSEMLENNEADVPGQSSQEHSQASEISHSIKVELDSSKENLISECHLSIHSIISALESLDDANLKFLSRALKDICNKIAYQIDSNVTEPISTSICKNNPVVQLAPELMYSTQDSDPDLGNNSTKEPVIDSNNS